MAVDRMMLGLARGLALAGGAVLLALVAMICVSVAGSALARLGVPGFGPVRAGYELVELGIAFVVFAFLPLAQLDRAHATVEVFAARLPRRANAALGRIWALGMAAVMLLIAWRLGAGTFAKARSGETTFLLALPIWWAYAACCVAAWVAAVVTLWDAVRGQR
ncbi:MAG: TRAP transporter small permease subunit [Phaeovulum sp.]|uniref:TRAP transporter small permease n=1 Tax=Phaeovulum sp. TaxID=2934796 RepID=UPI002730E271|nr:TRAP transporter small permease subunit [Phaeovulum sp.]MDP2063812.1 TRAP transporter small permease subunit [Phaeovulum sp.]